MSRVVSKEMFLPPALTPGCASPPPVSVDVVPANERSCHLFPVISTNVCHCSRRPALHVTPRPDDPVSRSMGSQSSVRSMSAANGLESSCFSESGVISASCVRVCRTRRMSCRHPRARHRKHQRQLCFLPCFFFFVHAPALDVVFNLGRKSLEVAEGSGCGKRFERRYWCEAGFAIDHGMAC